MKKVRKRNLKRIVIALLFIYATISLVKQEFMIRELKSEKSKKQAQLTELKSESDKIREKVDNKEDITYIEKIARDELDMVRPNEIIYDDINKSETDKETKKE